MKYELERLDFWDLLLILARVYFLRARQVWRHYQTAYAVNRWRGQ